jgi:hypothetical protein
MRNKIIIVILFFVLSGCSSEKEIITDLKPTKEDNYSMFVYFNFPNGEFPVSPSERGEVEKGFEYQYEIYDTMNEKLALEKLEIFGVRNSKVKDVQVFKIKEFPTFIVFDKNGVVLQTTDMEEIKKFLIQIPQRK